MNGIQIIDKLARDGEITIDFLMDATMGSSGDKTSFLECSSMRFFHKRASTSR